MKRTVKKALPVLLAAIMVFGAAPLAGLVGLELPSLKDIFADKAEAETNLSLTYNVNNGEVTITDCDASLSGELKISSSIEGYPVTSIGNSAFSDCKGLTSIIIPDSVTSIGDSAFYRCTGLTSITIPDSVTSIGDGAFYGCTGLTSVTFGENSQLTSIGEEVFYSCTGLTGVTIPDSVTSIGDSAFFFCTKLTSVTFGENSQLTSISNYAFGNCAGLTSATIPDSVTSIGKNAFYKCTGLTSVTFGENGQLTSIGEQAFKDTGIYNDSSNWENDILYIGNNLIEAKSSFQGNCIIKSGTKVLADNAFYSCEGLTGITLPDSVTSIGYRAFYRCSGLTGVTFPDSVTIIDGYAFFYCTGLTSVTFGENSKLTSIGEKVFYNCTGLTSVTIPDSVTSIGDNAFFYCTGLTSVTFGKNSQLTSIGEGAFRECTALTDVYYSGTKKEWNAISIGSDNTCLTNANIHFYNDTDSNTPEEPIINDGIVKKPSTSSISYGDSIILHVDSSIIPEGGYVEWAANNGNFDMSVSADGTTCKISPKSSGKTVFTATVYDKNGNIISSDTQEMTAKAGFFDKIVAFFKKIFGMTKTIPEAFKGIF
ncbi:MAG: leucine-rich repeat domain-containing protein [Acutalibacteraceae bacterium]